MRGVRTGRNEYEHAWGNRWVPDVNTENNRPNEAEDSRDGHDTGVIPRSERKRMWRKNLSAEKLAKLRERDAARKRMERQNMSAEKRKDVRTKDTARKAALRRERRLNERGNLQGGGDAGAAGGEGEHMRRIEVDDGLEVEDYAGKLDAKFRKISVQSLLN